ncbi:MAG: hypothetical protein E6J87_26440 [Deltaproteobacteria bacterium]|nr:MAG: hypothetical protein E6J87_26440 [Deltaproteobacteria bacterium]
MALRASSKKTGGDADITAITREVAGDGGVAHGKLLIELVDAVIDETADPAAGPGLLVEAGAVLGMFHLNDRVADAMGAPLDELMLDYRRKLGEKMGMDAGEAR